MRFGISRKYSDPKKKSVAVMIKSFETLFYTATRCNTSQHTATLFNSPPSMSKSKVFLTLQHTATNYNTLQHAATRCNTLQHTATHGNTLQLTAWRANPGPSETMQHTAKHYNTLQHSAALCNTPLYVATHRLARANPGLFPTALSVYFLC